MKSRRALVADIVLATEVPFPTAIRFQDEPDDVVSLHFNTLSDARLWTEFLGVEYSTYLNTDGNTYLRTRPAAWNTWKVHLWAFEFGDKPAEEALPDGIKAALTKASGETADETTGVETAAVAKIREA